MISGVSSQSSILQQLMAEMYKNMQNQGTSNLSSSGLQTATTNDSSSVDGSDFLSSLDSNTDSVNTDDDQLTQNSIGMQPPSQKPMGPPPGMFIDDISSSSTDNSSDALSVKTSSVNNVSTDTTASSSQTSSVDGSLNNSDAIRSYRGHHHHHGTGHKASSDVASSENTDSTNSSGSTNDLMSLLSKQFMSAYQDNQSEQASSLSLSA